MSRQPRIDRGFNAQLIVKGRLPSSMNMVSCARSGSNKPDLVVLSEGRLVQFEIKSCDNITSTIVPISCTVNATSNTNIDRLVPLFTENKHQSINDVVVHYHKQDSAIGFPCDEGSRRSGKLPKQLRLTSDHDNIHIVHKRILDHFVKSNITYLAVVCRTPTVSVHVFHTGHGHNALGAPMLPTIASARLGTYGSSSLNSMRVALKITLPSVTGLLL